MAEAHSAVAFSFAVTHEGVNVNFDVEVLRLIFRSGIRSWRKRMTRFGNSVKNGIFPGSLPGLCITEAVVTGSHLAGHDITLGLVDQLLEQLPGKTVGWRIGACCVVGFGTWTSIILGMRYSLKALLTYKGWMYGFRVKQQGPSFRTRLWALGIRIASGFTRPQLYSYQGSLPALPVPGLQETMNRYLRSVRPLLDDEQYARMEKLSQEFQKGIGKKLQRYLILKRLWSSNYVSDWWEEYVYLRGRSPIMVNSNFYGIDAILRKPTTIQAARAANVVHGAMLFRRAIDRQQIEPIMVQGLVPLCSWQYERVFNTTRIPGIETDKIVHLSDSTHLAVYCRGKYWRVPLYYKGTLLTPCELEIQFQRILDDKSEPDQGEERLAALTAGERTFWAETRQNHFNKGLNRTSLTIIETSAFVLVLDDEEFDYDPNDPSKLDHFGRSLLHGKGYDRWFDKSFTLVVAANGRVGFNAEHSWADAAIMSHFWEGALGNDLLGNGADAPIMGHLWEYCLGEDLLNFGYREDGHCRGKPKMEPPAPVRLRWDLAPQTIERIESAYQVAYALLQDVDLHLLVYSGYGKGFMKKCRVSPDAYVQMALQLAYYRDAGRFRLTYEASMTRLFREGRTETVRPCTIESCAWVKAMEDNSTPPEKCVELLRTACAYHQRGYQDAMCGKGIDRHLFCLYVVSKYLEVDSPFLKEVLSEPWRLSTSQTPHGQTSKLDLVKHPDVISAGGGFGPVADDGYGVSYIIAGEDTLFFHISSKKSSADTDSNRFAQQISRALADIRALFGN